MKQEIIQFEANGLFNQAGLELVVYYDKVHRVFTSRPIDCKKIPARLIETPYKESFCHAVRHRFTELLTEEEKALVYSYTKRRGFFGFLHESNLYGKYEEAYYQIAELVFENWQMDNNIVVTLPIKID